MNLPIQSQPVMRMLNTLVRVQERIMPQACGPWTGTAPFCSGTCDCEPGKICQTSTDGDGARCWTGVKTRCCDP
ncbi:hypothetical protein NIES3787_24740 [Microcystis aeruginosa NIES-3787]|jgi:hypothetical protein|uniref:Uncharacterized protein n=1 Tax=Microcystis aeruginosa NIES-3787 TaxID=2517782 RepID=A0A6H9GI30_MICAE|nr:hypothetical protein NIES3787_24740 [Microcystis aeruginosa NIES-3787]